MKRTRFKLDQTILGVVVALLILGVAVVYSASSFKAAETHNDSGFYLRSHLLKVLFGFLVMLVVSRVNYRFWLKISPFLLVLAFCALAYLVVSSNVESIRGSKRWLALGALQFQPSDLARIALVLFLSAVGGRLFFNNESAGRCLMICLLALAFITAPILLQPDVGTAALTACVGMGVIFVSGYKIRYLLLVAVTTIPTGIMVLMRSGYQKERVAQYLTSIGQNEFSWQIKQSLIALGNGGPLGLGLGASKQKYHFLPDPFTDFIYSIVGEELGILGTMLVLILFFILISRGTQLASQVNDFSGKLLAVGLVLNIGIYAFANAGVVTNLLPTTGIPMPFLSYGGTALIINLFGVGILLNIANEVRSQGLLYPVKNVFGRQVISKLARDTGLRSSSKSSGRSWRSAGEYQPNYSVLSALRQMDTDLS